MTILFPSYPQTVCTLVETRDRLLNKKLWCIYEHHLHDPDSGEAALILVGSCALSDVYYMADAQRNTEWLQMVKPSSYLYIKIVKTGERMDCQRGAIAHMREQPVFPPCNLRGVDLYAKARVIVCVSTGVEYNTQQEAAKANNINQGHLSQHLAGSCAHVKGLVFKFKDAS
jgi:hypothetical protein